MSILFMKWAPDGGHDDVVYVYLLTCTVTDKKYVGISYRPPARWEEHFHEADEEHPDKTRLITKALRKYGFEHFDKEILAVSNRKGALELEAHYCEIHNCLAPNGYNLKVGGIGRRCCSDEWRQSCSVRNSGSNNPMFGKSHKETSKHMMRTNRTQGSMPCGSNHHNSKLTEDIVLEILSDNKSGKPSKLLSEIYDVSIWTIRDIIRGRTWKHLSNK